MYLWFVRTPGLHDRQQIISLAFANCSTGNTFYLYRFMVNSQLFEMTFSWRICRWLRHRKHVSNIIWKCSTHHWFWTFLILDVWHIWRQIRKLSFIDHRNNSISTIKGRKPELKLRRKWNVCSLSVSPILMGEQRKMMGPLQCHCHFKVGRG